MKNAAALLRKTDSGFAELMATEMGKPLAQGKGEVEKCAVGCEYFAEHAAGFLQREQGSTPFRSFVCYEPIGVILAIMPWNFPFWQVFRCAAPALMAGNVGLLKHASNVPQCALKIEEIFREAGFPEGAFQTLLIGSQQVDAILNDPRVVAATLTGSEQAGIQVKGHGCHFGWDELFEQGHSQPRERQPGRGAEPGQQQAFRQQLTD